MARGSATFGTWWVVSTASTRQAFSISPVGTRPARRTSVRPSSPRTLPRQGACLGPGTVCAAGLTGRGPGYEHAFAGEASGRPASRADPSSDFYSVISTVTGKFLPPLEIPIASGMTSSAPSGAVWILPGRVFTNGSAETTGR